MKRLIALMLAMTLVLAGCGQQNSSDPGKQENASTAQAESTDNNGVLSDGEYQIYVTLEGGTGKATIESPCTLTVKEGQMTAKLLWSSKYYDYMLVDGEKYLNLTTEGNSSFEIPVKALDQAIEVMADTTAMSTPHEIAYTLTFSKSQGSEAPEENDEGVKLNGKLDQRDTDISSSLTYQKAASLEKAECFALDYYDGGYTLATITDGSRYLIVPEGASAPSDLDSDIKVLQKPVTNVYLAASAVMDMYVSMNAVSLLAFTGTRENDWYIEAAKSAMASGSLKYAGKYSAPDYEMLRASKCGLAIENTMILHSPEVKEQLEKFGIPVLVDYSSYESDPLGRMEWIKLYGTIMGTEAEAEKAFEEQAAHFTKVSEKTASGKSVAFFYITSDGQANVRKGSDYLAKIINLAGGDYVFSDLGLNDSGSGSTMSMTMEEFYASAKNADYIIYNSAIEGELSGVNALLKESALLANFKAVKEGNVYCTTKNLYQSSMQLGTILEDIYHMLQAEDDQMTYLYKLK